MTHNLTRCLRKRPAAAALALLAALQLASCATPSPGPAPAKESAPASAAAPSRITDLKPTVILVSLDGFRADYLDFGITPNLARLAREGVRARSLTPVFPSLTFPNHYSIITGLYPENHGIVANTMRDPKIPETFSIGDQKVLDDPRWWGGEPLWVTAEKQGQISASMFWVGSSTRIQGVLPRYWLPYDKSFPREKRVSQVLNWLDLPADKRPTFITLYFEDVDSAGHEHGPGTPEVRKAMTDVDASIGQLLQGLEARGVQDQVNVIVVSDHGMAAVPEGQYLFAENWVKPEEAEVVGSGAMVGLYPKASAEKGSEDAAARKLARRLATAHPHLKAYLRSEIPRRFHYRFNDRIPPVVLLADLGWYIAANPAAMKHKPKGMHGFDNRLPEMQAILVARGPGLASGGKTVAALSNLHVYPLVAHLLGLQPAKNDGSLKAAQSLLRAKARK